MFFPDIIKIISSSTLSLSQTSHTLFNYQYFIFACFNSQRCCEETFTKFKSHKFFKVHFCFKSILKCPICSEIEWTKYVFNYQFTSNKHVLSCLLCWEKHIFINYVKIHRSLHIHKYKYKYIYFTSIFKTKNISWQLLINSYIQYLQKLFTNRKHFLCKTSDSTHTEVLEWTNNIYCMIKDSWFIFIHSTQCFPAYLGSDYTRAKCLYLYIFW